MTVTVIWKIRVTRPAFESHSFFELHIDGEEPPNIFECEVENLQYYTQLLTETTRPGDSE